ncbi:hypothetical protein KKPNMP14_56250 [Klebsiella pneumoniae subsp. pneumoniae MP14]|nr:hypothetical protein KKPNMP14_56250 [Klebsiella pneumoniae subsp. pneumoniae MP14]
MITPIDLYIRAERFFFHITSIILFCYLLPPLFTLVKYILE